MIANSAGREAIRGERDFVPVNADGFFGNLVVLLTP